MSLDYRARDGDVMAKYDDRVITMCLPRADTLGIGNLPEIRIYAEVPDLICP